MLVACHITVTQSAGNRFSDTYLWALIRPVIKRRPGYGDRAVQEPSSKNVGLKQGSIHQKN